MVNASKGKPLPSDVLTTSQATMIAKVSRQTLARWIKEGVIDGEGVTRTATGRYRIRRWALTAVLDS